MLRFAVGSTVIKAPSLLTPADDQYGFRRSAEIPWRK
jgi:hypothetical protein